MNESKRSRNAYKQNFHKLKFLQKIVPLLTPFYSQSRSVSIICAACVNYLRCEQIFGILISDIWLTSVIQICNVKPISENGPPSDGVPLASVPPQIARFYQVNDVSKFLLDRPLHKGVIDKDNEFKVSSILQKIQVTQFFSST